MMPARSSATYAAQAPVFDRRKTHAWRGLNASGATVSDREAIGRPPEACRVCFAVDCRCAREPQHIRSRLRSSPHDFDEHAAAFGVYAASQELPKDWRTEPTAVLLDPGWVAREGSNVMAKDALEQRAVHGAVLTVEPSEASGGTEPHVSDSSPGGLRLLPTTGGGAEIYARVARPGIRRSRAELTRRPTRG